MASLLVVHPGGAQCFDLSYHTMRKCDTVSGPGQPPRPKKTGKGPTLNTMIEMRGEEICREEKSEAATTSSLRFFASQAIGRPEGAAPDPGGCPPRAG